MEDFLDMAFETLDGLFKNLKINIDNCPVCLGKLNDHTITTTFGHVFCKGCHHKSLLYSNYCLVCKNTIGNTMFKTEGVDSDVVTYDDDSDYDSGDEVEIIDIDTDDDRDCARDQETDSKSTTSLNSSSLLCHSSYSVTYLRVLMTNSYYN
jgi:hypothetical protein